MKALTRRLDSWIRTNHSELRGELKRGMMPGRLKQLEEESGADLSEDFRQLLRWRNGQKPNAEQWFCPEGFLLGEDGINEQWSKWMELEYNGRFPAADWFHPSWVPFVGGANGTYLCVDAAGAYDGVPGQVIEFHPESPERRIRAESLAAWLEVHAAAIEKGIIEQVDGKYQVVDGRDADYGALCDELTPGYPIEIAAGTEEKPAFYRLLDAIRDAKPAAVQKILDEEEVELDRTGPDGRPPLVTASISGNPDVVRILLDKGADLHWHDWTDHRQAIHWACEYGPLVVPVLIEAGADVDKPLEYSALTPLMLAAWSGHASSVQALLDAGADPTRKSSLGETAFSKGEGDDVIAVLRIALDR